MVVSASISPVVSTCPALALELYQVAAATPTFAKHLNHIAKSIGSFALIVKQVGATVAENDTLPSPEAIETLEDINDQCMSILNEIKPILLFWDLQPHNPHQDRRSDGRRAFRANAEVGARLDYLAAHLNSLRATLAVMLQTIFTAQSIWWARIRPTISPQQTTAMVANEKNQLEILIIEQQISILSTSKAYEPTRPEGRLLLEKESCQSLVAINDAPPQPVDLYKHQDKFIASLDISNTEEQEWLPAVRGISRSHVERLLERWTRLQQLEATLLEEERKANAQRRENQQPTVESESEDGITAQRRSSGDGLRLSTPTPRRSGSVQPLFTETSTLPLPVSHQSYGPTVPLSPASSYGASPRPSVNSFPVNQPGYSPVSPRTSIPSLPVDAAAAVSAQDSEPDLSLEIPWTLCTRRHYWKFIDATVISSNNDLPSSAAMQDRNAWTEVTASWVAKNALQEAGYKFTQVQKEKRDVREGRRERRTVFETCFCVEGALSFGEVRGLVERTVELYRETRSPSPPPRPKKQDDDHRATANGPQVPEDRDKTPVAKHQSKLERSNTGLPFHPPHPHPPPPPSLDRTLSLPLSAPKYPPNPHTMALHLPMPPPPYPSQAAQAYSPQAPYPSQGTAYSLSNLQPPISAPVAPSLSATTDYRRMQNNIHPHSLPRTHSPLRQPHHLCIDPRYGYADDHHSSTSTTSDSDAPSVTRSRKHRSRSRRPSTSHRKKKGTAMGALMGVGGLTALLDGLVGL